MFCFKLNLFCALAGYLLVGTVFAQKGDVADRPNVLFIAVDDLRPELNCFGAKGVVSPNIDRLAEMGTVFSRAYCQYSICGPSRVSLLSGLRPTRSRFSIREGVGMPHVDRDAPGCLTLPQYFKQNGYTTHSLGKVYHSMLEDDLDAWSQPPWRSKLPIHHYNLPENIALSGGNRRKGPAFECADVPDEAYPDGLMAQEAVRRIEAAATNDSPFFLAVGFWRPHLPFNAPKKYWDFYPEERVEPASNSFRPKNTPDCALHNASELRSYTNIPTPIDSMGDDLARTLIRAYRACVSFSDANVGKLLDALEQTGQFEDTVIVLWGDNGWQLGENSLWSKDSNFERSLRIPLIVVDPRMKGGDKTDALVELVDVYPSLCDLCGLTKPAHLEGTSVVPVMGNPEMLWKPAVFSCLVRPGREGWSVRTDRYRYTEWRNDNGGLRGYTLFDLQNDPEENASILKTPENEPLFREMEAILSRGWKQSIPNKKKESI